MSLSNYSELQTAIGNWLHRDDLTSRIPEFITLCEAYLNDDLITGAMIAEATITPSQVVAYVALPDGYKEQIAFVDNNGERLVQLNPEELADIAVSTGSPAYYSITSRINFDCIATSAVNYTMTYYKSLDIATDSTNGVLTNHPNLYLYGSLIQAEPFLKNDMRVGTWHQLYDVALKKANNRSQKSLKKLRTEFSGRGFDIVRGY